MRPSSSGVRSRCVALQRLTPRYNRQANSMTHQRVVIVCPMSMIMSGARGVSIRMREWFSMASGVLHLPFAMLFPPRWRRQPPWRPLLAPPAPPLC